MGLRRVARLLLALLLTLGLCYCSSISPQRRQTSASRTDGLFTVEAHGVAPEIQNEVILAAQSALADIQLWGTLEKPVLIVVHPSHEDLEQTVRMKNVPWLRAWAKFDRIDLQSPDTFGHRDYRPALRELLSHELTHIFMYQRIGTAKTWSKIWVPFWFREGMASWTSRQGYRRGTHRSLGLRLQQHAPATDPLLDGQKLTKSDQPLAYGAAHWAFDRLIVEVNKEGVLQILQDLRIGTQCSLQNSTASSQAGDQDCSQIGSTFGASFARHVGMTEVEFARQFRETLIEAALES